jgi:hypothetical protein
MQYSLREWLWFVDRDGQFFLLKFYAFLWYERIFYTQHNSFS